MSLLRYNFYNSQLGTYAYAAKISKIQITILKGFVKFADYDERIPKTASKQSQKHLKLGPHSCWLPNNEETSPPLMI